MNLFKTKIIRTALASAAVLGIALGMASTATGAANAGNLGINLHLGNGIGIYYSSHNRYNRQIRRTRHNHRSAYRHQHHNWQNYGPRYRSYNYRHYGNYYQPAQRQFCGPRRKIVSGYQYGHRTKVIFKRYSNCRFIRR